MTGSADPGSVNPFVGPRPLGLGEPIYGRDREVRDLDNLLAAERIVVLHSPSGAGKSSLLQAGMLPRFRGLYDVWGPTRVHQEPDEWNVAGRVNRYALSTMLGLEEGVPEKFRRRPKVLARQTLADYLENRPHRRSAPDNVLLVFDQFEEVLTVDPLAVDAKNEFFTELGELLQNPRVWALFALREDYLAPLDPYARQVTTHLRNRFRLELLGLDAARQAIAGPAAAHGRSFPSADDVVRDLARIQIQQADGSFVEQPGRHVEPMHLQVVCRRLWNALPEDGTTLDGTLSGAEHRCGRQAPELFSGVDAALAGYYDDAVERASGGSKARARALRDFFGERLITARGIRRQVLRSTGRTAGLDSATLGALLDTHLVRVDKRANATWYELAHDRLIAPIREANAAWRQGNLAEFQQRAFAWEREGRPAGLLLAGAQLDTAEAQAAEAQAEDVSALTDVEQRFLGESRKAQDVRDRARRQASFIRWLTGAVLLAVTAGGLAAFVLWRGSERQREAAENLTRAAVAANRLAEGETTEGNLLVLEVKDPEATPTAMDALHRALADPVEQWILEGHTSDVATAAWSGDGRHLVTASWDTTARVWNAATGEVTAILEGHSDEVWDAAWSPDGRRVATASWDATTRIWDPVTGDELAVLEGHDGPVLSVAWSGDGTRLATASQDGTVRVRTAAGKNVAVLRPPEGTAEGFLADTEDLTVAWNGDGTRLADNLGNTVHVWDPSTGQITALLEGHGAPVLSLAWSGDGTRLATASADGTARIWDVATGAELALLEGHADGVRDLAWSPDGERLVTASHDLTARVWDARTAVSLARLEGHTAYLWSVTWSADGAWIVTTSDDRTARLWRPRSGPAVAVLAGHAGQVLSTAWDPLGKRLVTASSDRTARIWGPLRIGEDLKTLWDHPEAVTSAAWSPDGTRAVTTSLDRTARVWDLVGERPNVRLAGHAGDLLTAVWDGDGRRIATASLDHTARIWDAATGRSLAVLAGHGQVVQDVAWSPDGTRIATASWDHTARIWGPAGQGGGLMSSLSLPHEGKVTTVAFSSDGSRVLTASADRTARTWDTATGRLHAVLHGHEDTVHAAAWSPDETRVLTISYDKTGRIWSAAGEPAAVLRGHEAEILEGAWSPDGTRVLTGSLDRTARIWDAVTGEAAVILPEHPDVLTSVAWSPDGGRVVTASWDGTVRLSRAATGELVASLTGHRGAVESVAWSGDGHLVLTASEDGTARIWAASENHADSYSDYLRGRIRSRLRHCLPPAFYRDHLGFSERAARRRHEACEACGPRFFERLADGPARQPRFAEWRLYEEAWDVYERCFIQRGVE